MKSPYLIAIKVNLLHAMYHVNVHVDVAHKTKYNYGLESESAEFLASRKACDSVNWVSEIINYNKINAITSIVLINHQSPTSFMPFTS